MSWKTEDWLNALKKIAPALGGAFGGPAGAAAGQILGEVLLGDKSATKEEIAEAVLGADIESLLKLKAADQQFEAQLAEIEAKDRDSARGLAKAQGMRPQIVLSALYTTGYFLVLAFMVTAEITFSEQQQTLVGPLIGVLTTVQIQIFNFWFGSSSGSKRKTELQRVGKT